MQRALALIFLLLLLVSFASYGLADELTLRPAAEGTWTICSSDGEDLGTLSKVGKENPEVEAGGYSLRPKGGDYLGVIDRNGNLQLLVRHATVTPSEIQLYLDVLEAIKKLK
jgi:hypothetical protein